MTEINHNNRLVNVKKAEERFPNYIWANDRPDHRRPPRKYLFICFSYRTARHCLNDHDTYQSIQYEMNCDPSWAPVRIIDLDTDEIIDFDTEIRLNIKE